MKYFFIKQGSFILFLLLSIQGYAQTKVDSININRAKEILLLNFPEKEFPANHLVYIFQDYIMLIYEKDNKDIFRYYEVGYNFTEQKYGYELIKTNAKKRRRSPELNRIFTDCPICREKIYFLPDSIASLPYVGKSYEYFMLFVQGEKKCEYNRPLIYLYGKNVNHNRDALYLLDAESYAFLVEKLYKTVGVIK